MAKEKRGCKHDQRSSLPKLPDGSQLEDASAMFRALGDPFRLRLLARLAVAKSACPSWRSWKTKN